MMKKLMSGIMLLAATVSGAVSACNKQGLSVDVVPQRGGAWVLVEKDGVPQPGMEVVVKDSRNQRYTTSESGMAFVYMPFEVSRSMTFEVADENGDTVLTKHFVPANRS